MIKQTVAFILGLSMAFVNPAYATVGGEVIWQLSDAQLGKQEALASVLDSAGNMIISGFEAAVGGDEDFYTVKISPGGTVLWHKSFDLNGENDRAIAVAVDSNNNVIVAGHGSVKGNVNFLVIKYGPDGNVLWSQPYSYDGSASGYDYPNAVTVDSDDNIYVAGHTQVAPAMTDDFVLIKLGPDGSYIWDETYDGGLNKDDRITGIATGDEWPATPDDDFIVVTGYSWMDHPADGSRKDFDIVTIKYNFGGNLQWLAVHDGGSGEDRGQHIAVDPANDIIISGYISTGTRKDMYTAKYGRDGGGGTDPNVIWDTTYSSINNFDYNLPQGLVLDDTGDIFLAGAIFTDTGMDDFYTARHAGADGSILWERVYDSPGIGKKDVPTSIIIDAKKGVFVTGYVEDGQTGEKDFLTLKYHSDNGNLLWHHVNFGEGEGSQQAVGIAVGLGVSLDGNVYVAGWSDTQTDFFSGTTTQTAAQNPTFTVIDNAQAGWSTNQWKFYYVLMTSGPNQGANKRIAGNDSFSINTQSAFANPVQINQTYTINDPHDYNFYAIKYDHGELNPPTGVTAEAITENQVDLSWQDNSASLNEDEFCIERCKGIGCQNFVEIACVPTDTSTYQDFGLNAHTRYSYRVRSRQGPDYSNFSETAIAFTTIFLPVGPSWLYLYNGPDNMNDIAYGIGAGPDNNPVVTGTSMSINGQDDYYTTKIRRTDKTMQWEHHYDDPNWGTDISTCIAVDSSGNVVISGYSFLAGSGGDSNDILTFKFDTEGPDPYSYSNPNYGALWADTYNGPAGNDDRSEAVDAVSGGNGSVVVGYGRNAAANDDIYVIKYGANGRVWAATPYDSGRHDYPSDVVLDPSGDVIVSGKSYNGSNYDQFLSKYSGSSGIATWAKTTNHCCGNDEIHQITSDSSGNIYAVGYITNEANHLDMFIGKYDAGGNALWVELVGGDGIGYDEAISVKYDAKNDEVVVGGTITSATGSQDLHLRKYESNGTLRWKQTLDRSEVDDELIDLAVDQDGNICAAGNTDNGSNTDVLVVCYDRDGTLTGSTMYNGEADDDDSAKAMTVNSLGEMYVAGSTTNLSGNKDYLVFKCDNNVILSLESIEAAPRYTTVDLSWTDNTPDENGYYLWRKDGTCNTGGSFTLIGTPSSGTTSFADSGLSTESQYCYRIQTFKNGIISIPLEKDVSTLAPPPPGCSSSPSSTTRMEISWTDIINGEEGFEVLRCTGASCSDFTSLTGPDNLAPGATVYSDSSICELATNNNAPYSYRVRAYNSTENWESSSDCLSTLPLAAQPVGNLSASAVSEGEVVLSWTDQNSDTTAFRIYKCQGEGCTPLELTTTAELTYSDLDVLPGQEYHYQVTAFKNALCGWQSTPSDASASPVLGTPCPLSASNVGTTTVRLGWPDNFAFETGFGIDRCEGIDCLTGCSGTTCQIDQVGANTTTYDDETVCVGAAYSYRVRAYKGTAWESACSASSSPSASPTPPGNLNASRHSEQEILVTWDDTNQDETGFTVQRCEVGVSCPAYGEVGTAPPGTAAVSFTDQGLSPGHTYSYRVRADKNGACGWPTGFSNDDNSTPTVVPLSGLSANQINSTRIDLAWTNNTTWETGFEVERCEGADCLDSCTETSCIKAQLGPGVNTYSDTAACQGANYNYRVRAYKGSVRPYEWETSDIVAVGSTQALKPTNLAANPISEEEIELTWDDANNDETGFTIERCQAGTNCPGIAFSAIGSSAAGTQGSYLDQGLLPNRTYYYQVKALKEGACGWPSPPSDDDNATPTIIAPSSLAAVPANSNQIDLSWTNNTSWETGIDIERCFGAGCLDYCTGTSCRVGNLASGTESYSDTTVCPGSEYSYRVTARKGTSPPYSWKSSTPFDPVSTVVLAPTNLTAERYSEQEVILTWNDANNDETGFTIERCEIGVTCPAFSFIGTAPSAAGQTSFIDQGVQAPRPSTGKTYAYRVRADKGGACGWPSGYSNDDNATLDLVPPGEFKAASMGSNRIDLTWQNNTSWETAIAVKRCDDNATVCMADPDNLFSEIESLAPGTSFYSDTNLCGNSVHTYLIQAKNASWPYNPTTALPASEKTMKPTKPDSLAVSATSESEAFLAWIDGNPDETGFVVERCDDNATACEISQDFHPIETIAAAASPNYILFLRMDEELWSGVPGEAYDSSGNARHGSALGDAALISAGRFGNGGSFGGSDDYISLGDIDELDAAAAFSIELWFKRTADQPSATAHGINNILLAQASNGDNDNLEIGTEGGSIEIYLDSASGADTIKSVDAGILNDTWYHLVLTYDKDAQNMLKLYLNGSLLGEWNDYSGPLADSGASPLTVGISDPDTNSYGDFNGFIDELAIYPNALTGAEVLQHHGGSYLDTGLSTMESYTYRIKAYQDGACGWQEYTQPTEATLPSPPGPSGLTATPVSTTQVNLSWTDNSSTESGYKVLRCQGATCENPVEISGTLPANSKTYSDTSLCQPDTYRYVVAAIVSGQDIPNENGLINATPIAPAGPTYLTITSPSETESILSWDDNMDDETGYKIDRCAGSTCVPTTTDNVAATTESTYNDTGLSPPGATFNYRIYPYKEECLWENESSSNTITPQVACPSSLEINSFNTTEVVLGWTDRTTSETAFEIERCDGVCNENDAFEKKGETGSNSTEFTDQTSLPSSPYSYRVRAINSTLGWSSCYSNIVSLTTSPLAGPTGLSASRESEVLISLAWNDNSGDENSFVIERGDFKGGDNCTNLGFLAETGAGAENFSDSTAAHSRAYCYQVKACKQDVDPGEGDNGWCTTFSNLTNAATDIYSPDPLQAVTINTTRIDLSWADNTDSETGFAVERCDLDTECPNYIEISDSPAGEDSDGLADLSACNGKTYRYRVKSIKTGDLSWPDLYTLEKEASTSPAQKVQNLIATEIVDEIMDTRIISVTWTDANTDEEGFTIERCEGFNCTDYQVLTTAAPSSSSSYEDADLPASSDYCYRISPYKNSECPWDPLEDNLYEETCSRTAPGAPSGLTATADGMAVNLGWNDNSSDEDGFEIERTVFNGRFVLFDTVGPDVTTYTNVAGIEPHTTYTYRVRAVREGHKSGYSGTATAATSEWQEPICTP